ncbi:hypothetical protein MHN79_13750 [Vibrio sp. Of14-4]|uniref:KamA family radical SAM protein n=1 Tax=Vibrio sp. Of14-4 TaxID=2724878 RepID=UPI001EF3146D|nr:hypothetical protein [Vibrio sp. Of14-4]MCG7490553.1 hypothetical protein [Vibrio sp. Of14-4]
MYIDKFEQPVRVVSDRRYKSYQRANLKNIAREHIPEDIATELEVTSLVFPFRVNDYVLDELIDWDNIPSDPMFRLLFPMSEMLDKASYQRLLELVRERGDKALIQQEVEKIRASLNPHPSGQVTKNRPAINGKPLNGFQHKYKETLLYFPSQAQYCHAYCSYCFRWAQFTAKATRMNNNDAELLFDYLARHQELTDVLLTGGDPMTMRANKMRKYLEVMLRDECQHIKNIRIGTKSLAFWPSRFVSDGDAQELCNLFRKVVEHGKSVALMAHFSHPNELSTPIVRRAIRNLQTSGVTIRTQAPLMKGINDNPDIWVEMWNLQVSLGLIPYYMFIDRDTGAKGYFEVPLERALEIYTLAYRKISGLCKTVRGPVMSTDPGKIQLLDISIVNGEKVFCLQFIQARNPEWINKVFFAQYNCEATWIDQLKPAFGKNYFFWEV